MVVEYAAVAAVPAAQCAAAVLAVEFAAALELEVAFLENQAIAVEAAAPVAPQPAYPLGHQLVDPVLLGVLSYA